MTTWATWAKSWGGSWGGSWGPIRKVGPQPMRGGVATGSVIASGPDALLSKEDFMRKFGPKLDELPKRRKKRNNDAIALLLCAIASDV